jgi:hypothetical protein
VPGIWATIVIVVCIVGSIWGLGRLGLSPYRRSSVPAPEARADRRM